jgi:UDP-glucose 4-epimerase
MQLLVTGGAGFIGSHLADKLLELGHEVTVIDDFSLGKKENLQNNKNLKIIKKSICDNLDDVFKEKIDAVFHLAALPRVQFSIKNPIETHNANVNGTLNLLDTCKKFNVKRFIFSSSSAVYGDQKTLPLKEDMKPNPMSPYALHKLVGEYYCRLYSLLYGLEAISLRYFNVFGPRLNPEGDYACLIPKFINLIKKGVRPTIYGNGTKTRDFTFVSDAVEANILAFKTGNKDSFGQVFNVGSGKNISVNDVTKLILKFTNRSIKPIYGPEVIEPEHTLADISKIKNSLSWYSKTSFEEGLQKTIDYFK